MLGCVVFVTCAWRWNPADRESIDDLKTSVIALEVSATAIEARLVAQADTNETTTATLYTPRFVGDTLVGGAGAGTNAVWISKGTTTNDWIKTTGIGVLP